MNIQITIVLILSAMISSPLPVPAQVQGGPGLRKLALDSPIVAVGSVKMSPLWVVDPKRMIGKSTKRPDGTIHYETAKPGDFVLGRLITFQIDLVLKGQNMTNPDHTLRFFSDGLSMGEGQASFLQAERYILFIEPLDTSNERFKGTELYNPTNSAKIQFDPKAIYAPTNRLFGAVNLRTEGDVLIQKVQDALGHK